MSSTANSQQSSSPVTQGVLDDDFAEWIHELLDEHHILGASVAITDNGKLESAGYGLARLPDVPSTPDTIYRMASTSKAIGAAVMGLILEDDTKNITTVDGKEEKLTWSTPIIKVLGEDFDMQNEYFNNRCTIEDALSNRSGVSGHDYNFGPWMGRDTRTYVRSLRHIDAVVAPMRTTFQYTNTMFAVIGYVIEKIEGKSFEEAARDRLWKPLGMKNTFATLGSLAASDDTRKSLARGYWWSADKELIYDNSPKQSDGAEHGHYVAEAHLDFDLVGPAAAVLSTANDYIRWVASLLYAANPIQDTTAMNKPEPDVISHKIFDELTTARTLVIPSMIPTIGNNLLKYPRINPQLYALGWFTDPWMYDGQTIVHHPGGVQGFGSHVFLLPEHKFGLVVMENGCGADSKIAYLVGREIIGRKLGMTRGERKGERATTTAVAEQDPRQTDGPIEEKDLESVSGTYPPGFNETIVPGIYEHKAYGRIQISLAPSASLGTINPTINGVRFVRNSSEPIRTEIIDKHKHSGPATYHITFLGRRSFLPSFLLHPPLPNTDKPSTSISTSTPTSIQPATFFTLEWLWPHGDLQSDPLPNLPKGHGTTDDSKHPFRQESLYESTGFMACAGCFEMVQDGQVARLGLVLGRTEASQFRARKGRDRERPVDGWRGKMVWFERVE